MVNTDHTVGQDHLTTTPCDKNCCFYWDQCECETHDESYKCNGGTKRGLVDDIGEANVW